MPDPVIIANRPRRAWAFVALWTIELLAGLGFVMSGARWLGAKENGAAAVLVIMGLVLLAAGIVMTAQSLRTARLKGPAIVLSAEGLRDNRLADTVIPWDAIAWRTVFNGRSYAVQFTVAEPQRSSLSPYWEQRIIARFHTLFGYPEFAVPTLATGLSVAALSTLMRGFKPES